MVMEYVPQLVAPSATRQTKTWHSVFGEFFRTLPQNIVTVFHNVRTIGVTAGMSSYDKSKLCIFNLLNFFQFITGMIIPLIGLFYVYKIPVGGWLMACLPAWVSLFVLVLNHKRRYDTAIMFYFIFYPACICLSYINGISLGIELSFILYGILSVFFIQDIGYMIFSISFSMLSYFFFSVILKKYIYQLEKIIYMTYLINQVLAILYIFYVLYLINTESG